MKNEIMQLIDRLAAEKDQKAERLYHCGEVWSAWKHGTMTEDDFEELPPDILLGDVLEELERGPFFFDEASLLIDRWGADMMPFNASLQSIFDRAEWEEEEILRATFGSGHEEVLTSLVPKQKEIRSLFEYLLMLKI